MGSVPPVTPLDWANFCVKDIGPVVGLSCEGMRIRLWLSWQPLKMIIFGRLRALVPEVEGSFLT
jgi:hypothetical protein